MPGCNARYAACCGFRLPTVSLGKNSSSKDIPPKYPPSLQCSQYCETTHENQSSFHRHYASHQNRQAHFTSYCVWDGDASHGHLLFCFFGGIATSSGSQITIKPTSTEYYNQTMFFNFILILQFNNVFQLHLGLCHFWVVFLTCVGTELRCSLHIFSIGDVLLPA